MTKEVVGSSNTNAVNVPVLEMGNDNKEISIKFSERSFAKMLVDLLGKKQVLSGIEETPFRVKLEDLCQFHYLLRDKIEKEQFTTLRIFSVSIHYNDQTKRTLNSIENLESFLETRNVVATSVSLTWDIILKFPNVDNVENQKVEMSFITKKDEINGEITINIEHTNQAWAIEVLNLLKSKISEISYKQNKAVGLVSPLLFIGRPFSKDKFMLMFMIPIMFIMPFLPSRDSLSKQQIAVNNEFYQNVLNLSAKTESMETSKLYLQSNLMFYIIKNDKKEYVQSLNGLSPELKSVFDKYIKKYSEAEGPFSFGNFWKYLLGLLLILALLQAYLFKLVKYFHERSFILLTRESDKLFESYEKEKNPVRFTSLSAIVFTVVIGITVNLISTSTWFTRLIDMLH